MRKFTLGLTALALLVASVLSFIPLQTSYVGALDDAGYERIYVAGLATCLNDKVAIDEGDDNITSLRDYWDNSGNLEVAVVGVIINQDGMYTCLEVMVEAAQALGLTENNNENDAEAAIFEAIWGDSMDSISGAGIDGDDFEDAANAYIQETLLPYIDERPLTDEMRAERLLPLYETCYNHRPEPFSGDSIIGFQATGKTETIYADYNTPNRDEVNSNYSINKNESAGDNENAKIGDIFTNYEYGNTDMPGEEDTYPYINPTWRFYPFGNDAPNFLDMSSDNNNQSYSDNLVLLSCGDIVDTNFNISGHGEGKFDSSDYNLDQDFVNRMYSFYELDDENNLIFDGQTADDIENGGTPDLEIALGGANDNPTCESQGISLSWLFCPIINGALDAMDWMFRQFIEPFLITQPLTTNDGDFVYEVWQGFRTIGNILLLFGLLFIVFGQAIGGGLVDAYTAKKAMPRILVAAIFINLSYFGVALLVDIFNILGSGVGQLISAPLDGRGSFTFTPNNLVNAGGLLALALGGKFVLGLTATSGFLPLLMMTVLLPMMIVVISIFGTIIVRRGLIIVLAVIAPVAAALFVLPNTEKYAKQWLSLLVKTLMVYPIIMAIFAVADLLSVMLMNANGSTSGGAGGFVQDSLAEFVGLVVLFVPFFLIPFAFKFAGGAISTVSNAITGFGNKRYENYKGNELDPKSRIAIRKNKYEEEREAQQREGVMLKGARRLSQFKFKRAAHDATGRQQVARRALFGRDNPAPWINDSPTGQTGFDSAGNAVPIPGDRNPAGSSDSPPTDQRQRGSWNSAQGSAGVDANGNPARRPDGTPPPPDPSRNTTASAVGAPPPPPDPSRNTTASAVGAPPVAGSQVDPAAPRFPNRPEGSGRSRPNRPGGPRNQAEFKDSPPPQRTTAEETAAALGQSQNLDREAKVREGTSDSSRDGQSEARAARERLGSTEEPTLPPTETE